MGQRLYYFNSSDIAKSDGTALYTKFHLNKTKSISRNSSRIRCIYLKQIGLAGTNRQVGNSILAY
jgi:hypothetical protein